MRLEIKLDKQAYDYMEYYRLHMQKAELIEWFKIYPLAPKFESSVCSLLLLAILRSIA